MRTLRPFAAIAFVVYLSSGTAARATDEEIVAPAVAVMEETIITATRSPRMLRDVPANTSVLTAEDLQRSAARKLDDVLRLTPGIDVDRPMGILYTTPAVSVRGMGGRSSEGRTLVLLDGVPINNSYSGGVAWNSFATADIERIEVVRGAASALYGSHAMGGVINLISRGWARQSQSMAKISFASQNTPIVEAYHSASVGRVDLSLTANRLSSDGYIVVPREKRKDYDQERTMAATSVGARLRYALGADASLTVNATHHADDVNAGRPLYNGTSAQDRFSLAYQGLVGEMDWQGAIYANLDDYEWTYDTGTAKDLVNYVSNQPKKQVGMSGRTTIPLGPASKLTLALDYKWGQVDSRDRYVQVERRVETSGTQQAFGLAVESEFTLHDRLILYAGARYDGINTFDGSSLDTDVDAARNTYDDQTHHNISPKAGLVYHPDPVTTLRASVGRAFQAPSLYNLYRTWKYYSTTYAGNPGLDPERLTSYEVGVDRTFGSRVLGRLTLYRNNADDFIYSITTDVENKIKSKQNVGEVTMQGVETEISVFPVTGLSLSAAYTFNESTIETFQDNPDLEGKLLIYAPKHKLSMTARYADPRLLTADVTARLVGERFSDDANGDDKALESYYLIDLRLARRVHDALEATVAVTNLLDRDYEEKRGYLAPGRLLSAGVTLWR
jgi:iron complex outermembrane recepter protein